MNIRNILLDLICSNILNIQNCINVQDVRVSTIPFERYRRDLQIEQIKPSKQIQRHLESHERHNNANTKSKRNDACANIWFLQLCFLAFYMHEKPVSCNFDFWHGFRRYVSCNSFVFLFSHFGSSYVRHMLQHFNVWWWPQWPRRGFPSGMVDGLLMDWLWKQLRSSWCEASEANICLLPLWHVYMSKTSVSYSFDVSHMRRKQCLAILILWLFTQVLKTCSLPLWFLWYGTPQRIACSPVARPDA